MESIDFPFPFDEMPLAGKFLYDSFVRDQRLFIRRYPVFDESFRNRFYSHILRVKELVCCSPEGQKIQKIRECIHRKIESLEVLMVDIREEISESGFDLITAVEQALESQYHTEVIRLGRDLLQFLDSSSCYSESSSNLKEEVLSIIEILESDQTELRRLLYSRAMLTEDIFRSLNNLWATMQDVLEIGHSIYEEDTSLNIQDYQIDHIARRLRTYRSPLLEV